MPSHSVIFFTDNLGNLTVGLKEQVECVFKIFGLDFLVNIVDVQSLFGLLGLSGLLLIVVCSGLLDLVLADHLGSGYVVVKRINK